MQAWRPRPDLALPQSHRITSANMYVEEQRPLPGSQALEPNLCLRTMCRCVGRMSKYISRAHTDIHSLHAVFAIAPPDACPLNTNIRYVGSGSARCSRPLAKQVAGVRKNLRQSAVPHIMCDISPRRA